MGPLYGQQHSVEDATPHRAEALDALWAFNHNHLETSHGAVPNGSGSINRLRDSRSPVVSELKSLVRLRSRCYYQFSLHTTLDWSPKSEKVIKASSEDESKEDQILYTLNILRKSISWDVEKSDPSFANSKYWMGDYDRVRPYEQYYTSYRKLDIIYNLIWT